MHETQEYWRISSIYYGRINEPLTMKQGLQQLNKVLSTVGPKRLLRNSAGLLMADLISPKKAKSKSNLPAPTPLRNQANA